jgi:hypothetical protein
MRREILRLTVAGALLCGFALAQEEGEQDHGVARLSLANGDVSVLHGDTGEWVAAVANAPLVDADHVSTAPGAVAELQFDSSNFIRIGSDSEVRLAGMESRHYQVQVSRGTVTVRLMRQSDVAGEVDTPSVSVRPMQPGIYRITVNPDGQAVLTVRSGEAEVASPKGSEHLTAGQTMLVRGSPSDPEFQVVHEIARDEWDGWNQQRDQALERPARSYQYVNPEVPGAGDLDNSGTWAYEQPYGWAWSPSGVGPDWAPYRNGRWVWTDWYGWTWVDYDLWGWAPFHYGRWFYAAPRGWCWSPGPIYQRPFWRPGLVAFFGFGGGAGFHLGVGFGFGSVGWVPLAPFEPFYPWYGRGWYRGGFGGRVGLANNINIVNTYRNARVLNGVTGLDAAGFARGGRGAAIRAADVAQHAALMRGPLPVTPVAASQRFSDRQVRNFAARTEPGRFFSRQSAGSSLRIPFEQQRANMEQYVRRSSAGPAAGVVSRPGVSSGWRSVPGAPAPQAARPNVQSGWQRFDPPSRSAGTGSYGASRGYSYNQAAPQRYGGSEAPRVSNYAPRYQSQGYNRAAAPIRINPPIVRERAASRPAPAAQRSSGGGGSYRGGGSSRGGGGGHGRSR